MRGFIRHWLTWTFFLAPLLALPALAAGGWSPAVRLIALISPAYMLHQIEEHAGDRFRTFINKRVFGGWEALTPLGVFWINVPLVWGLNLAALILVLAGRPEPALAAVYVMLVNAGVHTLAVFRFGYNPGLATSLALFLPLSAAIMAALPLPAATHALAFLFALLVHAAIAGYALGRVRRLKAARVT